MAKYEFIKKLILKLIEQMLELKNRKIFVSDLFAKYKKIYYTINNDYLIRNLKKFLFLTKIRI
jgi:hypothetical protein